jgi:hypothetical protein
MKRFHRALLLFFAILLGRAMLVPAQEVRKTPTPEDAYKALAPGLETRLRFVTDFSFPGGPAFQVKVYDWLMGPRQEFTNFPLEGFATIEVKAGEAETTMDGVTTVRHEGELFAVPEGTRLSIRIKPETGRGDNLVSLHAVVAIRK